MKTVSAEEYRNELIRDAFINGIISNAIRQRLLENKELTLDTAFDQARSLDLAQKNSQAYEAPKSFAVAVSSDPVHETNESSNTVGAASAFSQTSKNCPYCGRESHARSICPARCSTCHK